MLDLDQVAGLVAAIVAQGTRDETLGYPGEVDGLVEQAHRGSHPPHNSGRPLRSASAVSSTRSRSASNPQQRTGWFSSSAREGYEK